MKRYFTFADGSSDKFWHITTADSSYTVTYGRTGTSGQSSTKTFADAATCDKEADKIIKEKLKKGYTEDGTTAAQSPLPTAQSPKLDHQPIEEVLARYDAIIKNAALDDLLPFLQWVEKRHYEALKKHIKNTEKYWTELVFSLRSVFSDTTNNHKQRGTKEQIYMIRLSFFALANKRDNKAEFIQFIEKSIENPSFKSIFDWAKPTWLGHYLLEKINDSNWEIIRYQTLIKLESEKYLSYNSELFVKSLIRFGYQVDNNLFKNSDLHKFFTLIEKILKNSDTIIHDLLSIFEYDTGIEWQNYHYQDVESKKLMSISIWREALKRLLSQQKIERNWLIENCLQVQLKNWNNNALLYFRQILTDANPTPQELVQQQAIIFSLLGADNKQVVSFAVEQIKSIYEEADFDATEMLNWLAPVLTRTDNKTATKTLLGVLEKLLKKQPELNTQVCPLLVNIFGINDLALQERTAKIIAKYGKTDDAELTELLPLYAPQLLGNVPQLLAAFLETESQPEATTQESYQYQTPTFTLLKEENRVKMPQNWQELLFFIGEFISNDTPLNAEIVMNSIVLLKPTFPPDWEAQFEVYYKKLVKTWMPDAVFVQQFLYGWYERDLYKIEAPKWHKNVYQIQDIPKMLAEVSQAKYKKDSKLCLLCLPTHAPHWIDPTTLIQRMLAYLESNEQINTLDLSIALCRLVRENANAALALCHKLPEKYANLMRYVLGAIDTIGLRKQSKGFLSFVGLDNNKDTKETQILWALAARSRFPAQTFEEFKDVLKEIPNVLRPIKPKIQVVARRTESNWLNQKAIYEWKELKIPLAEKYTLSVVEDYNLSLCLLYSLDLHEKYKPLLDYSQNNAQDSQFKQISPSTWISFIPHFTESCYTNIVKHILKKSDGNDTAIFNQIVNNTLQPGFIFREMSLWTLAGILLNQKREDRALAVEVVIHHVSQQSLPLDKLGQKLGYLLAQDYAPVQRLSEGLLLVKDISPLHNDALRQLLAYILPMFTTAEPPKNTKKLLEIYFDVLVKTNQKPDVEVLPNLDLWKENSSLKSLIKNILQRK